MNPAIASGDDVEPPATLGSICCPAWFPLSSASVPDTRFNAPVPLRNPRQRFFPVTTDEEWNDWRWQMRHRIRTVGDLEGILRLTPREREAFDRRGEGLPVAVTPFYMSLIDPTDPADPLRRAVVPSGLELVRSEGEARDPLGEDRHTVAPGLVHRYPDRVLLLATDTCATYCRYCTRSRWVGRHDTGGDDRWTAAIEYIEAHPEVRDVLISGGDPLTLSDNALNRLLARLRRIRHVELIRLGTKTPVVIPQRITGALVRTLRRYHPLFISIHFTHPNELVDDVRIACARLADAGIPLGSQTVLLRGINDDVATLRRLFTGLLRFRVRPYYLYQCDPILGAAHFRTTVQQGLGIISGLRGHISGYAVPAYVVDAPGGGGKIQLLPDACVARDERGLLLRNFAGEVFRYPESAPPASDQAGSCSAESTLVSMPEVSL